MLVCCLIELKVHICEMVPDASVQIPVHIVYYLISLPRSLQLRAVSHAEFILGVFGSFWSEPVLLNGLWGEVVLGCVVVLRRHH